MCPFTSLPAGDGPNRFSPTAVKDWQPRRKSVSNACERCRRRKIRCDGDTPCATCKRFSLPCVRTQKPREVVASEHQAALESRIHQLEAQLAAHVNAPMHGMESIDQNIMAGTPPNFDWQSPPPQLSLDTSFPAAFSPENEMDLGSFSAGSIPSIAITECELIPTTTSPSSPVPSFWSGTTRASSPEMPSTSAPRFAPNLAYAPGSKPFSPPTAPHTAPSWEFMAQGSTSQLKPEPSQSQNISRKTSMSSMSLESDEQGISSIPEEDEDIDVLPLAPAPRLPRQGIFAARTESPPSAVSRSSFSDRSRAITTTPFPSRFEAETLTTEFVQYVESQGQKVYSVSSPQFGRFCEVVYPDPKNRASTTDVAVSTPMARFHVFLAMAIGMKLRIRNSPENTNSLLNTCYELAMQQASAPTFWQENGGVEAAQLLSIFASIRPEPSFDPKPLQPSFSW
ncbi:hypothetical protein BS50DRAFT_613422 [Corynespora cassiicola Philippines]|uniref:Zn(2)-C6 fungal-type domain-containing protein n=1 Tax=Corynespora cassiicola Philippines TaxID=1448308 RepID=A0A2T2N8K2_CORCC|nr:hypothetical protein BS50DRAFT_613422 [Corynespora cassiicola Philippines]